MKHNKDHNNSDAKTLGSDTQYAPETERVETQAETALHIAHRNNQSRKKWIILLHT